MFTYGKFNGDRRLRLERIQEIGFDGSSKPPYEFYYESGNLPKKGSKAKDYAGYYNGKNNNQTLVPFSIQAVNTLNNTNRQKLADRTEDISFLKIGVLNEIKYPTGGSTKFSYEANNAPADAGSEVQRKLNRKVEIIVGIKVPRVVTAEVEESEKELEAVVEKRFKTLSDTIVKGDRILLENILFKTNYSCDSSGN